MTGTMARPAGFDPANLHVLDPQHYAGDPYPMFAWLRDNAPVYWDERDRVYCVTRHADVTAVERNTDVFVNGQGIRPWDSGGVSLVTMDAPEHTAHRRMVNRGFTPRMVGRLEDHIRTLTADLVDAVADRGSCDFVDDIAVRLPLTVICELMGLPVEDWRLLRTWSDDMVAAETALSGDESESPALTAGAKAFVEYVTYLKPIIDERRSDPAEDLISILVAATDDESMVGGRLLDEVDGVNADDVGRDFLEHVGEDNLVMFLVTLLIAGNETTRNAASGAMEAFSQHPEQWAMLRDDPSLMPTAVEEILRWTAPVQNFCRTAVVDTEVAGTPVAAGQKVCVFYPSANRDPAVFDAPDQFHITRDPNPHLTFGVGPHFCLGANLARLELRVLFETVLQRLPDIHATRPATRTPNSLVRTITSLPVAFTPA